MKLSTEICPMCKTGELNLSFVLSSYRDKIDVSLQCDVCTTVFEDFEVCIKVNEGE